MLVAKIFSLGARIAFAFFIVASLVASGFGQAAIKLSATVGPPTSTTLVSGSGFSANADVHIYFDAPPVLGAPELPLTAVANNAGAFSKIAIQVPASAPPGKHTVFAVDPSTGKGTQASFLVRTNWLQFHWNQTHTGYNPYENVLSPTTVGDLRLLRDFYFYFFAYEPSSPAVAYGAVYLGSVHDNSVYAWNASTGALLWSYGTGQPVFSSPAVANGVVYIGSDDSYLYALCASTGTLQWKYQTGSTVDSSPTVVSGVVYVGSGDGYVYALDAGTGALKWKYLTGASAALGQCPTSFAGSCLWSSPAVANGVVYIAAEDQNLYALNASSGALLWKHPIGGAYFYWQSSPAVADGVVYIGSTDGNVYALNASNGAELWQYATGFRVSSSPAVANGVVYIGSQDDNVYALDASTGALQWKYPTGNAVVSSPAVANGVVYIGSDDGYVYALNSSTGALLWNYSLEGLAQDSSPAVADGVLYIGSFAFDLKAGMAPANRNDNSSGSLDGAASNTGGTGTGGEAVQGKP